MVINANMIYEAGSLKADSFVVMVFYKIIDVINKIMLTMSSMIIALEGECLAQADLWVITFTDATKLPIDYA